MRRQCFIAFNLDEMKGRRIIPYLISNVRFFAMEVTSASASTR
jgi:hypothetical protein